MRRNTDKYAELYELWGESIEGGFTPIPNELLRNQRDLGIDSIDFNLIAHLIRFWWYKDRLPYPSTEKIAEETGISEEELKKHIRKLKRKGYLETLELDAGVTGFNLSGLVDILLMKRRERFID